jgi:hypothetical protein
MNNSIIDEVRAARAALAEEHGYDRKKILEWARKKQAELKSEGRGKAPVAEKKRPGKKKAAPTL